MWERASEKAGELVITSLTPVIVHKLGIKHFTFPLIKNRSAEFSRRLRRLSGRLEGGQNPQKLPQPKINTKKVLKCLISSSQIRPTNFARIWPHINKLWQTLNKTLTLILGPFLLTLLAWWGPGIAPGGTPCNLSARESSLGTLNFYKVSWDPKRTD